MSSSSATRRVSQVLVQCTRFQGMQRGAVASPVNMRYVSSGNQRNFSTGGSVEDKITSILNLEFAPTFVEVKDVSGGCGAMFNITVESTKFKGISLVNQHKMVTKALSNEIKDMHGLTVKTAIPK